MVLFLTQNNLASLGDELQQAHTIHHMLIWSARPLLKEYKAQRNHPSSSPEGRMCAYAILNILTKDGCLTNTPSLIQERIHKKPLFVLVSMSSGFPKSELCLFCFCLKTLSSCSSVAEALSFLALCLGLCNLLVSAAYLLTEQAVPAMFCLMPITLLRQAIHCSPKQCSMASHSPLRCLDT